MHLWSRNWEVEKEFQGFSGQKASLNGQGRSRFSERLRRYGWGEAEERLRCLSVAMISTMTKEFITSYRTQSLDGGSQAGAKARD